MRRLTIIFAAFALAATPALASADGQMPQMDFANPLTGAQVVWMAIIMIVLYFLLSRWALPQLGSVIEDRQNRIKSDLDVARHAKAEAEHAVAELNLAIRNAREESQAAIAEAVGTAKARARAQSDRLNQRLDAELARAEAEIDATRKQAMAALAPVAREVASSLILRLAGKPADPERLDRALASAQG
ncbi:F0F1 ATP synthase subunit B [Acidiphilium sp. AL]|uniref:ATP synthase subunit b n=1 Tax=Acidiphilium iwatense TaxID=768198 RepID=A0ABS9DSZ5_9PROT|nr:MULTISPECIES: F0F1 ATP synthase subunit B [Acidiphilium]MCF3945863.1 F0F1 ATP synthase subunit B [Acidiphilium iwatense]MCU4159256.1 F0F1 ATP synthase subunit B [Acidiphilium sp. AL]